MFTEYLNAVHERGGAAPNRTMGFLKKVPSSASADNSAAGKGSYSWYVDENNEVKSMLYAAPRPETAGYRDVYP